MNTETPLRPSRRSRDCVRAFAVAVVAVMLTLRPAVAQELTSSLLPDSVAEQLVGFHNMETTTRLQGDARIGPGTTMSGGIAVLGGSLTVEGTVEGDVVVINGDLVVLPGGSITGDGTVAGGAATVTGTVAGGVRVYREPLRYRVVDGAIVYVPPDLDEGLSAGRDFAFGRTELRVSSYGAYNRAEGLPIGVGPRVRFGGTHPVSALALLILRTAVPGDDLDSRRLGYDVRVEQLVAPALGLTLGARLLSVITPIESWGITDRESALAAFILRTDYRDHYQRQGWSAYASLVRPGTPWSLGLEYLDEEHGRAPIANPVVLLDARPGWRPEPSIAVGSLRSVAASLRYDTRNEERDPSAGWLIDVAVEQALGGAMVNPGSFDQETGTTVSRVANSSFMTGRVDVRRYARLSPYARIGLRVIAAGSVDGASLPPQRQVALGGEGSLPGYRLFEFDCGARSNTVTVGGETFHPYYGCDRMAVVQLEYQAGFPFARRVSEALGLGPSLGYLARWVAFFDAGRAWNEPGSRDGRFGGNDDFSADAGLGIRLGPLGGYWTVPLSGHGQGFHMFVRIAPRL